MVIRNAEEKNKTMEEKSKNQSNGKINRFFKRAAAWEISDSDADSDIESHQTETVTLMNPTADTLDHGICDHAVQEDLKSCLSASEPASPQQVATSSPSQNIMKRIPADIKACQARAESRKLKREIRKTEKERRKAQEVLEKQRRREAFDTLKLLRPDQCLKYMTVCIDPGLLEDPGSDALMKAFDSLECNYYIEPQEVPCSITWRRNTPNGFSSVDDTLVKSEEENEVVLLVDPRDFLKRLLSVTQGLVVLQLWGNTEVLFLDTWHELSQHVSALTKAIAKRPYKKQLKTQLFSFCTDGGWPSSIRVEKDGTGLKQLWKRQIKQFNRVSPVVAGAIAAAYPSPSLLLQAYEECSTEKDRFLLLSDIRVKAEDNRRERRIGTDLSRRVYLFITSTNPDLVLDLG
ncbi:structure-specific endonuclease subunit EME2 isoform X2 [Pelodiscus sinensis]|uniref:structure-specific endonuclease subunit EME2 isoform X2 n=1 Tax=Pelodiscus sinensis TaxID=13735 RepID=UPI003F6A5BEB